MAWFEPLAPAARIDVLLTPPGFFCRVPPYGGIFQRPHCSMKPIFIESSQAPVIRAYGNGLHVHLDGTQTGGPDIDRGMAIAAGQGIHFMQG